MNKNQVLVLLSGGYIVGATILSMVTNDPSVLAKGVILFLFCLITFIAYKIFE